MYIREQVKLKTRFPKLITNVLKGTSKKKNAAQKE